MPKNIPKKSDPAGYLDADMTPADIIDILSRLKYTNVSQLDRQSRDYLVTAVAARVGK